MSLSSAEREGIRITPSPLAGEGRGGGSRIARETTSSPTRVVSSSSRPCRRRTTRPSAPSPQSSNGAATATALTLEALLGVPDAGRWLMMSDVCKHCVAAPCQHACPTGAIIYNEYSNVYIQPDICNGCAYCIAACPFGVITRSSFDGHSHKCTLCYDRQRDGLVPACAKACPTASIQFGPLEELRQRAQQRVEELHQRGRPTAHL